MLCIRYEKPDTAICARYVLSGTGTRSLYDATHRLSLASLRNAWHSHTSFGVHRAGQYPPSARGLGQETEDTLSKTAIYQEGKGESVFFLPEQYKVPEY